MSKLKLIALLLAIAVITLAILTEVSIRLAGLVDQPLFDADATIGYIPSASQSGSFINRNDWVINEKHMGADAFVPGLQGNVLLLGDSIVWGGNPYARQERLGPQLQRLVSPVKVWPIAAGSWALQNELAYLKRYPEVVAAVDTIVIVVNSGDLEGASSWGCTWTHPREKPMVAAWFIARKYVFRAACEGTPPELKVAPTPPLPMLHTFLAEHADKRVFVVLYPDAPETADRALRERQLESMRPRLAAVGVREIVSVGSDPRWQPEAPLYKDGIHPSPAGMAVLASVIADQLRRHSNR